MNIQMLKPKMKADKEWAACKILSFLLSLFIKRIYLEAYVAKNFVKELLSSEYFEYADNREIHIRTFLCSARSYRKYVMLSDMPDKSKNVLLWRKVFQNFVWITEVTSHWTAFGRTNGVVILDATEANTLDYRPLIFAICNGFIVQYDKNTKSIASCQITGCDFSVFDKNLKKSIINMPKNN